MHFKHKMGGQVSFMFKISSSSYGQKLNLQSKKALPFPQDQAPCDGQKEIFVTQLHNNWFH